MSVNITRQIQNRNNIPAMTLFTGNKFSMMVLLATMMSFTVVTQAADNAGADALLNELTGTIAQLREIEARGTEVKQTRARNRREMDRLQSEAESLAAEKARIDSRVVEYTAEQQAYTSDCTGTTLSGQASSRCESRARQLDATAATLEADAAGLRPRFDDYNAEINAYNARDNELASQEEAFYEQAMAQVSRIDDIKGRFAALAAADGNAAFIADVQVCNGLQGFEDTLTCLRLVWRIVSSPGVRG
jgi:hypothetical protein